MLAYITGTVDQELLLRNEYLAAENRILRAQIKGRLLLSDAEKGTLAEIDPAPTSTTSPINRQINTDQAETRDHKRGSFPRARF